MSKLVWDKSGERYLQLGVDRGVIYPMGSSGNYGTGVAWNGLTAVNENPDGAEPQDIYADNIKYATLRSAENYGCTIEAVNYPEEFAICDGTASPTPGVYLGQQPRKPFGFAFRTGIGSDTTGAESKDYLLHIVYNLTASPSDRNYETVNENPDAIGFSWECKGTPVECTGYKQLCTITIDSRYVDSTKLRSLEDALYGTAQEDATLPSPDDVLALIA
jgi:hypothetical protein